MINLAEVFEKHQDEFLEFERVENKLHHRTDICAFLLLANLVPGTGDIVNGASHEEIYLDADIEKLAEVATEDDIITLIRCGVRLHKSEECLCMFA